MIVLLLGAIPAMAFGQTVSCDDCTHAVSVYMGEGGLVATADDADMVTYVATCGNATRSGELTPNSDGVVSMLFSMDNGLACHTAAEGNKFEIGPIMDGGWYWITDDMNSAVGNLVSMDVLDNDTIELTSAGDGVEMEMGSGAVFVKETSTGRVGILPNILPEPPVSELPLCGLRYTTATPPVAYQLLDDCSLDATFTMKVTTLDPYHGTVVEVGGLIRRGVSADRTLTAKMLASGHISYRLNNNVVDPEWGAIDEKPLIATWGVYLHNADPQATLTAIGVRQDTTNFNEFHISPGSWCTSDDPAERAITHQIRISAGRVQNFIIPEMPLTTPPTFINRIFTIACQPPAAQQGQELVPDNPFPPKVD